MSVRSYVRTGGVLQARSNLVRSGGVWVQSARVLASFNSADIYPSATFSFYLVAREIAKKFIHGPDRNKIVATGAASDFHTIQRAFPVTAGLTYRVSILGQADAVSTFLGFEFYNGTTFLASGGQFNPFTGVANGAGVGTLTHLGGGIYRYDKDYLIPSGVTSLNVRLLVGNAAGTGSFIANGEAIFTGVLNFTQI